MLCQAGGSWGSRREGKVCVDSSKHTVLKALVSSPPLTTCSKLGGEGCLHSLWLCLVSYGVKCIITKADGEITVITISLSPDICAKWMSLNFNGCMVSHHIKGTGVPTTPMWHTSYQLIDDSVAMQQINYYMGLSRATWELWPL